MGGTAIGVRGGSKHFWSSLVANFSTATRIILMEMTRFAICIRIIANLRRKVAIFYMDFGTNS